MSNWPPHWLACWKMLPCGSVYPMSLGSASSNATTSTGSPSNISNCLKACEAPVEATCLASAAGSRKFAEIFERLFQLGRGDSGDAAVPIATGKQQQFFEVLRCFQPAPGALSERAVDS